MKSVLVVGSGGREHALAWKIAQAGQARRICVAPGNDGYPKEWERWPTRLAGGEPEFKKLAERAKRERMDLVIIGPDNALADGIADVFTEAQVPVFGPTRSASRLESSKAFAKEVMQSAGAPTAKYQAFKSLAQAEKFLQEVEWNSGWVVKADGLALGKGVRVCDSREEALIAARELMAISGSLVIEERLSGEEISWLAFCDGERFALLDPARDFKRIGDGDRGPNTGGMGAFSPVPGIPAGFEERLGREVFAPVLAEMKKRGTPFRGLLYAGLMVDFARDRYWVIEFNARFGDPETQALLPRMEGDLFEWCLASAIGELGKLPQRVPFSKHAAVFVVGAARGYPGQPIQGDLIADHKPDGIFYSGVRSKDGQLETSGGRVLGALGMGASLEEARTQAYARIDSTRFEGIQFRKDIAADAAKLEKSLRGGT